MHCGFRLQEQLIKKALEALCRFHQRRTYLDGVASHLLAPQGQDRCLQRPEDGADRTALPTVVEPLGEISEFRPEDVVVLVSILERVQLISDVPSYYALKHRALVQSPEVVDCGPKRFHLVTVLLQGPGSFSRPNHRRHRSGEQDLLVHVEVRGIAAFEGGNLAPKHLGRAAIDRSLQASKLLEPPRNGIEKRNGDLLPHNLRLLVSSRN